MKSLLLITVVFLSTSTYAFNWKRCQAVYKKTEEHTSKESNFFKIILDHVFFYTTQKTTESFSSTTSYVSSTGECKAFAEAEMERINFVAETNVNLQMELADGLGDHLTALASLYKCNDQARLIFNQELRNNHSNIFSEKNSKDPMSLTQKITETIVESKVLSNNCNLEQI